MESGEDDLSRQRFLNQKLGKRMSHKAKLLKAKAPTAPATAGLRGATPRVRRRSPVVPGQPSR